MYEGITFDDFLKVGAWELGVDMGAALGACGGPCWSGRDGRLKGTGSSLSCGLHSGLNWFYLCLLKG